jgi:porin
MKRMTLCAIFILIVAVFLGAQAGAEESPSAISYSGDFRSRSTLTGDWGGARNDLAAKGVTFDINMTQVGIGIISGGKDTGWEYGGRGNLMLSIDTKKLGLWPGGFLMVEVEGNFGGDVNFDTGALMPVNSSQFFPMPGSDELDIPAVTFTQFFSEYAGVFIGKLDTTSGDANEFAHGKGDTQFFNLALNFNPVALLAGPYSTLGGGVTVLPTKDPGAAIISLSVISSDGEADSFGFNTLFKGDTTYAAEGRVKTDFFGLTGHQLVGGMYSTKNFASLNQNLRFIIANRTIKMKDSSWCLYYNFDQYIYEPKKGSGRGIGIFGRLGISDGNPNPVHNFYSVGIGGKGVISSRPLDGFGLGYYFVDVSNPKFTGPLTTREFLRNEYGVEAYYNVAITPWMKLTPDVQVIRPAQKKQIVGQDILTAGLKDVDTATVIGLRLQLIF